MFSLTRIFSSLFGQSPHAGQSPPSWQIAQPFVSPRSPVTSVPVAVPQRAKGVADLSWQEFELLIGELHRRQGYAVTMCSGDGADGGIDLRLEKDGQTVLVQCKHWKVYKVSAPAVRELFGVMTAERADRAILVTTGRFTWDAQNFAEDKPLELIDGPELQRRLEAAKCDGTGGRDLLDVPSWSEQFAQAATVTTPACPFCRSAMVLRQAKASGSRFWGCATFPRCRGKRNVRQELLSRSR